MKSFITAFTQPRPLQRSFALRLCVYVLSVCSYYSSAQSKPLTPCDEAYYANIQKVQQNAFHVVDMTGPAVFGERPVTAEILDTTGHRYKLYSVNCKTVVPHSPALVTLRLINDEGKIGQVESGADFIPNSIVTAAYLEEKESKDASALTAHISSVKDSLKEFLGKSIVAIAPASARLSVPSGTPLQFNAVDYSGTIWVIKGSLGNQEHTWTLTDEAIAKLPVFLMPSSRFMKQYSPIDRKAIRNGVWEYGMTQDTLSILKGWPDSVNSHDGANQVVYKYRDSMEIFYFNRAGMLTNHSRLEQ